MSPAPTICVVDDDEAVRGTLVALLEAKGYAAAAYPSAETFLAAYRPGMAGCALVDLRLPGMDGLALLRRLQGGGAAPPIIMITGYSDVPLAVAAMQAGAADFVEKPFVNEALLACIRRALDRSLPQRFDDLAPTELAGRAADLTSREREVLARLVVGKPNKIIAHELAISPRTVEVHRGRLMKKMQARSLSHLVRMALALHLDRRNDGK